MRRSAFRLITAVIVLGTTASLTACGPATIPDPTRTPTPSVAPVFASDEEALAAAEEAYRRYLEVDNKVARAGGEGAQAYEDVTVGAARESATTSASQFRDAGAHATADQSFSIHALQQADYAVPTAVRISVYVCVDLTGVDLVDARGASIVKAGRPDHVPYQVEVSGDVEALKVAKIDLWPGDNFCVK